MEPPRNFLHFICEPFCQNSNMPLIAQRESLQTRQQTPKRFFDRFGSKGMPRPPEFSSKI